MTSHLPPSLLALFAPRPPLPHLDPVEPKRAPPPTGIAAYLKYFDPPMGEYEENYVYKPIERKEHVRARKIQQKAAVHNEALKDLIDQWDPHKIEKATSDPYKTLFVSRINYETDEQTLKHQFQVYGPVNKVRLIYDKDGKSRGYAFIEFEKKADMQTAYKQADGKKIDGMRVLVDVERGRTVENWRPRRLGGGLGATRLGGKDVNQKYSGREPPSSSSRYSSSSGRDRDEDRHRDRDRESRRDRDREDRHRDRERERERERDRESSRRDRDREERESRRDKDRGKDRDRESGSRRDRERGEDRESSSRRDKDRGEDRESRRDKDRESRRDKDKESSRRDRDREERGGEDRESRRDKEHRRDRDREHRTRNREEDEVVVEGTEERPHKRARSEDV